jgi:hypothetical protein
VLEIPDEGGRPVFPAFEASPTDPFLQQIEASGKKWVVVTSPVGEPLLVLDADAFLRKFLLGEGPVDIEAFCHRPILVRDPETKLGDVLPQLRIQRQSEGDDVIDEDLILVWGQERRIITGADILGRLLRGIARPST